METLDQREEPRTAPTHVDGVPDFHWPVQVTEFIFQWLSAFWERLREYAAEQARCRTMMGLAQVMIALTGVAYVVLLWVCLCYVQFPVSPYRTWDFVEWALLAGPAVICLYLGGAMLLFLVRLLVVIGVYFTTSLGYLCWMVLRATCEQSPWLRRHRVVITFGMASALALATFADGEYRYWDMPFTIFNWAKFVVPMVSVWAALFCHLMGREARPRRIAGWTLALAVVAGGLVHWTANQDRAEYFLRKRLALDPSDSAAWVELAQYYEYQGDLVASDLGDEDHRAGDPEPWYEQGLDCLNRAVQLGANGFEVQFSRAKLADELGQAGGAIIFAREALRSAPSDAGANREDVDWLREIVARNTRGLSETRGEDQRQKQREAVRNGRRQHLPRIVSWAFHFGN